MLFYQFPAVRGIQAQNEYYICMIPLDALSKIFLFNYDEVMPEYRAQRRLNEFRIPEIKNYILQNRNSYVFSALAASIDGHVVFNSLSNDIGILEIDMAAKFLINDGQHRKAAIQAALEEDDSLQNETIPVVLFKDKGLQRSQQMFSDLNKHAVITSKSLNTLYESKEPIAIITKNVINRIEFFRKYTDKERDNLGKFSSNIFTLNVLYNANKKILSNATNVLQEEQFLYRFWSQVVDNIREWKEMEKGELSKKELREQYIVTQGVTILALGRLGQYFFEHQEINMDKTLVNLKKIDWLRSNMQCWENRAIKPNGNINRNEQGIFLTYLQIKRLLGIELSAEEKRKEQMQSKK